MRAAGIQPVVGCDLVWTGFGLLQVGANGWLSPVRSSLSPAVLDALDKGPGGGQGAVNPPVESERSRYRGTQITPRPPRNTTKCLFFRAM